MTMRKPVLALLAPSLCLLAWGGVAVADDQHTSSRILDSWKTADAVVRAAHTVFSTASISLSKALIQYQDRFQFMSPSY
jgi:hypothetical protein